MNCIDIVDNIARRLNHLLKQQPKAYLLPTENYGWENFRYRSPKFRLGHVQIFRQDKFCVIHCCVFPHQTDPSPIYGFDVVTGTNKITGVFLDLSPTAKSVKPFTNLNIGQTRERPEWGDIFSQHWLACRPTPEEMTVVGNEAVRVLTNYLPSLGDIGDTNLIIQQQNRYCLQQQRNEHTRKALTNILGPNGADSYMSTILFPTIGTLI
jgi:phycocyanobilin:ferredoxin oxidoreductase